MFRITSDLKSDDVAFETRVGYMRDQFSKVLQVATSVNDMTTAETMNEHQPPPPSLLRRASSKQLEPVIKLKQISRRDFFISSGAAPPLRGQAPPPLYMSVSAINAPAPADADAADDAEDDEPALNADEDTMEPFDDIRNDFKRQISGGSVLLSMWVARDIKASNAEKKRLFEEK